MIEQWEARERYGCKEIPNIRLSLMKKDEIVYTMVLDALEDYDNEFGSRYRCIQFSTCLMNDKDYTALVSKIYDKYIIEIQQYWRSAEDGKDYLIELPAQVFHNFNVKYKNVADGDPASWEFTFEEFKEDY